MSSALKHRIIDLVLATLHWTGLARLAGRRFGGRGAILMFHRVRPPRVGSFQPNALLEITPEFLDALLGRVRELGYAIVPLDDVPAWLAAETGSKFVALTFDDGYRDNVEVALPILQRHAAPFTMFVTTGFADGTQPLWWINLETVVSRLDAIPLTSGGMLKAATIAEKYAAYGTLLARWREMPDSERRADHDRLCTLAMVDQLATTLDACLGWDDLATLARHPLARIGVHTRSHPLLARLDSAASRDEMILAKVEIERRLGMPATSIAYPVGDAAAAGPREFAMAADFGLRLGVTTRPGLLFADHLAHPMALPRLSVNGLHQNLDHMEVLLSGLPFAMLNRGRRLNVG